MYQVYQGNTDIHKGKNTKEVYLQRTGFELITFIQ